jgi:hypothetical protein
MFRAYYTLEIELWENSEEAQAEAKRIFSAENIDKNDLLLPKHTKKVLAKMESSYHHLIHIAFTRFSRLFAGKITNDCLIVPAITLVVEINTQKDLDMDKVQEFVKNEKNKLFHRFSLEIQSEEQEEQEEDLNNE